LVKKQEAERAIRHLATEWADETGYVSKAGYYPSFSDFRGWISAKGYARYLQFRSSVDPIDVAEGWFEAELKAWSRSRH
jgi:hypothetical protein